MDDLTIAGLIELAETLAWEAYARGHLDVAETHAGWKHRLEALRDD